MEEMKRKLIYETKSNCFPKDKREAFRNTLGSSSEEDIPVRRQSPKQKRKVHVSSADEDHQHPKHEKKGPCKGNKRK